MRYLILLTFIFNTATTAFARDADGNYGSRHNEISGNRGNGFWFGNRNAASNISPTYFQNINSPINHKLNHKAYLRLYQQFVGNPLLRGSEQALQRALAFYVKNRYGISESCGGTESKETIKGDWIVVTDYTKPIDQKRQFFINLKTNEVRSAYAQHGIGSNQADDKNQVLEKCPDEHLVVCGKGNVQCKIPISFDDRTGNHKTQTGFFLAGEPYRSNNKTFYGGEPPAQKGASNGIRLEGVNTSTKKARSRGVVFHRASYVYKDKPSACAFSWGCPSTDPETFEEIKKELVEGTMFYNHTVNEELTVNPSC